jgi:hypothetical protein
VWSDWHTVRLVIPITTPQMADNDNRDATPLGENRGMDFGLLSLFEQTSWGSRLRGHRGDWDAGPALLAATPNMPGRLF